MDKVEMIAAVSEAAFVEEDACERVLTSYKNVVSDEVKKQIKKYLIIGGSIIAFLGIFATIFYLLGKNDQ